MPLPFSSVFEKSMNDPYLELIQKYKKVGV